MKLLLATRSAHKAGEAARILAEAMRIPAEGGPDAPGSVTLETVTLEEAGVPWAEAEEELEPFETFRENAASKARYFARMTGLAAAADDSGLEVDALGGRPGVRTKRFAPRERYPGLGRDDANNRHLIEQLGDLPPSMRGARYVCAVCLFMPQSSTTVHFLGEAPGRILRRARGSGGFGYDPIFLDEETDRSYAELTPGEKNARSHRGKAFRALAVHLAR